MVRIVFTPGEPAGIGLEVAVKLLQHDLPCELHVLTDVELLESVASRLGLVLPRHDRVHYQHRPFPKKPAPGKPELANASVLFDSIEAAAQGCLAGTYDAYVTGPVNKAVFNAAGIPFTGHTELLAQIARCDHVVMLLACANARVALVTTHCPLSEVAARVTPDLLLKTLLILEKDLKDKFKLAQPRIKVCGLNPHAGEGGHLGREEIEFIAPIISQLQAQGKKISGPYPADTVFTARSLADCDVVLAMYHDQGLPVIKALGFGETVNVTLGLPFVRTSVDHGTAFDLAGTGHASDASLKAAVDLAIELAS